MVTKTQPGSKTTVMGKIKSAFVDDNGNRRHLLPRHRIPSPPPQPASSSSSNYLLSSPMTGDQFSNQRLSLKPTQELMSERQFPSTLYEDPSALVGPTLLVEKERPHSMTFEPVNYETVEKPIVIQEKIHPMEKEEIQPVIYREREQLDVKQITQLLHETEIKPTTVESRELAPEVREPIVERGEPISENVILPSTQVDDVIRTQVIHEPIVNETIKKTIIEEIQPVLERDIIRPTIVLHTQPIYEKIIEAPIVYREVLQVKELGTRHSGQLEKDVLFTTNPMSPSMIGRASPITSCLDALDAVYSAFGLIVGGQFLTPRILSNIEQNRLLLAGYGALTNSAKDASCLADMKQAFIYCQNRKLFYRGGMHMFLPRQKRPFLCPKRNTEHIKVKNWEELSDMDGRHPVHSIQEETFESNPHHNNKRTPPSKSFGSSIWGRLFVLNWHQIKTSKARFFLAGFAVFIVVLLVALLISLFKYAALAFLKMAELETGEVDVEITSFWGMNHTQVRLTMNDTAHNYSAPRFSGWINVYPSSVCPKTVFYNATYSNSTVQSFNMTLDPYNATWPYMGLNGSEPCVYDKKNCFSYLCKADGGNLPTVLHLYDSDMENTMEWAKRGVKPPDKGKAILSPSAAQYLQVKAGDLVYLQIDAYDYLGFAWWSRMPEKSRKLNQDPDNGDDKLKEIYKKWLESQGKSVQKPDTRMYYSQVYLPVVVDQILDPGTKFASDRNTIMMDLQHFHSHFTPFIHPKIPQGNVNSWKQVKLWEYSQSVIFNLPPADRVDVYIQSYDDAAAQVSHFASEISYKLGFPLIDSTFPVIESMKQTSFIGMVLNLVLNLVIVILLCLASLLIYSVLTIDLTSRGFELAVLRSSGMSNPRLLYLLGLKCTSSSFPALVLGIVASQLLMAVAVHFFEKLTFMKLTYWLSYKAVITSVALAIIIPTISSIFPIRSVMSQSIFEAIDKSRSKSSGVVYKIDRSEKQHDRRTPFLIGFILFLFGFSVYYVFPMALLSMSLGILGDVFLAIILGMIFGLVCLSLNLQGVTERTILKVLLVWWEATPVMNITLRNVNTHRYRNRKTTIMYSLSLGFVVFMAATLSLQVESFTEMQKKTGGGFVKFYGRSKDDFGPIKPYEEYLETQSVVQDWAWNTLAMDVKREDSQFYVSNIGRVVKDKATVVAITPNFFQVTFDFLTIASEGSGLSAANGPDMMRSLYSLRGSTTALLSSHETDKLALTSGDQILLLNGSRIFSRVKPLAYLSSAPTFQTLSPFPHDGTEVLVSLTTYMRWTNCTSLLEIPMDTLIIQFRDSAGDGDITRVKNAVAGIVARQGKNVKSWDYRDATVRGKFTGMITAYFFTLAIGIVMIICFFSLMSSMYTNITEQTKEIGILIVLGLSHKQVYRIYIYEAFAVIFSSSMFGLLIGAVVAWTMSLQQQLWQQISLPFYFPWYFVLATFGLSVLFAGWASFKPLRSLFKAEIVEILRG
ncbi:hypothetical protein PROFUN_06544 [Planoprotostelium fungivorum]|uniref:ABC3 transporter permease C-terminal domain-containing protein n=1 Tax=Planoprotostelium fungivorum TaxID=1890364 RepID=A0A2P6MRT8_9EUKA|nr:hypothetical protein PROFUN_06544 [Planoprotostelium fungivorum]